MIVLQNPFTGQTANLSEMGKFPKAFALGFTRIGPVPATPAPKPTPPPPAPTPTLVGYVVGYAPVERVRVIYRW
jgi:hypothetical protein